MARFASETSVSIDRSQSEIRNLLLRYGASKFISGDDVDEGKSMVQFFAHERTVRFVLTLPKRSDDVFWLTSHKPPKRRNEQQAFAAWEQACRSQWRSLVLCIKAKLEAVASGISVFEDEFMAQIVLSSGQTVADVVRPQIAANYEEQPQRFLGLLPGPGRDA